jgi:hypothetical protein
MSSAQTDHTKNRAIAILRYRARGISEGLMFDTGPVQSPNGSAPEFSSCLRGRHDGLCSLPHERSLDPADPVWQHYESFKWWLLPPARRRLRLLLVPMQFSDRLRRRFTVPSGRHVFTSPGLVVAPLGAYLHTDEAAGSGGLSIAGVIDAACCGSRPGSALLSR